MSEFTDNYSVEQASNFFSENVDAVLVVDGDNNCYKSLKRKGIFTSFISETGEYTDLIRNLWYHFNKSSEDVVPQYHVFIPYSGKYSEKYSKSVIMVIDGVQHTIQMTIYPIEPDHKYLFMLDELDNCEYLREFLTAKKVNTIQNTYLFSMYIDIVRNTINSISVTEISGDVIHQQIMYDEWRLTIMNMFREGIERDTFLKISHPDALKQIAPGDTFSHDCEMMNLEGKYIWVKLIFSRSETDNPDDYRYVFMVQDIQETIKSMKEALKDYEKKASEDTLTGIYNHGRIETEMTNAIDNKAKKKKDGQDINVSFMILDIDHFKKVNDTYGHHTGDTTLVHFVETVKRIIKDYPAVIGRWGGEEFVVVMNGMNLEQSQELAEKVRSGVEVEPFGKVGNITCSIGLAEVKDGEEFKKAFQRMDEAVYVAKKRGRNNVVAG